MASHIQPADRLSQLEEDFWSKFVSLAREHNALNLGVGYPDFEPPKFLIDEVTNIVASNAPLIHQYAKGTGHIRLVNILSKMFSQFLGVDVDPASCVTIGPGADIMIYFALLAFVNPGDEIVLIEPYFDCYKPMADFCGGTPVFVSLRPKQRESNNGLPQSSADWILDEGELEKAFNKNTKAIVLNNPHNPTGKVFSRKELSTIARLCVKYDVVCVTDEVYQFITYGGVEHVRIASLPGMWKRTVTIGSCGKTFCVTGWKLGWIVAHSSLTKPIQAAAEHLIYSANKPMQEALAISLEKEFERLNSDGSFFKILATQLQGKRDRLASILTKAGMKPLIPQGGFFIVADISGVVVTPELRAESNDSYDMRFVEWLIINKKVATIPLSGFFIPEHRHYGEKYIRFCFAKVDSTFTELDRIFEEWQER